jgi:BirA family biotin operon repressor/biotin-[acetyl-CoA-carboxylase] ligase
MVRALRAEGLGDAMLKWPNDVLCQNRKLAGILIEMQGDITGPCAVVIGIGVNLKLGRELIEQIDQPVTDMFTYLHRAAERNRLMGALLTELADVLVEFAQSGFSGLRREWRGYHCYQNEVVRMLMPNGDQQEGRVLDVAEDGALLLENAGSMRRFTSGEVSMRGIA